MNIGFWNIRGVGKTCLWEELTYIRKFSKLNILVLSETKTSIKPSVSSIKKAGFHDFFFIPSIGTRGGMWLLWNHNSLTNKTNIIHYTDRIIVCSVNYESENIYLIFIYAPSREDEKDNFWSQLQIYIDSLNGKVILIGDLNEIEDSSEKWGGVSPTNNRFRRLRQIRYNLDLINPPTQGIPFTWRKKQDDNK